MRFLGQRDFTLWKAGLLAGLIAAALGLSVLEGGYGQTCDSLLLEPAQCDADDLGSELSG